MAHEPLLRRHVPVHVLARRAVEVAPHIGEDQAGRVGLARRRPAKRERADPPATLLCERDGVVGREQRAVLERLEGLPAADPVLGSAPASR